MKSDELDIETSQRFKRIGGVVLKTILILFSALAVYLVLFPIVIWTCMRFGVVIAGGDYAFLDAIGAPVEWFFKHCPLYAKVMIYIGELILP